MENIMLAVTGASGQLGQLVITELLRTTPANRIVALVRDPAKAKHFSARGVTVRRADYNDPSTLESALQGVERLLLISGNEIGQRTAQHAAVITAAKSAGVRHIAYTSILKADTSTLPVAPEHQATELNLKKSGLATTFLRNTWYTENYTDTLSSVLSSGAVYHATQGKAVAPATRADLAAAAAVVLTTPGHENKIYELNGDESFTLEEFARAVAEWSGKKISAVEITPAELENALKKAGVPDLWARFSADTDVAIAKGDLTAVNSDLQKLIGRKTTTLRAFLATLSRPS